MSGENLINNPEPIDPFNTDAPHYEQYKQIFEDLQGGMIKSYGRNYSLYLFIQFNPEKVEEIKQWIQNEVANSVTSTWTQFCDTRDYKEEIAYRKREHLDISMCSGKLCTNFFLSYEGYQMLGLDPAEPNNGETRIDDAQFKRGMSKDWERNYRLHAPPQGAYWYNPPEFWDIGGGKADQSGNVSPGDSNTGAPVHGLVLLAHNDLEQLRTAASRLISQLENDAATDRSETIGQVIACEAGYVLKEQNSDVVSKAKTIGSFGFADNISQPVFLKNDYDEYREKECLEHWDPKASLNLVLLKDPFGKPYSYGSYCVFQKIETNYSCFQERVGELAKKLECDRHRAEALVVGRFQDGTPIALSDEPNSISNRFNNSFNYANDSGNQCPLQAHIRKTNPRHDGSSPEQIEERRSSRIFRAGITYFETELPQTSNVLQTCLSKLDYLAKISANPAIDNVTNISGLLFVCFQSNISLQFAKLQNNWADSRKFPREETSGKPIYLDPLIGHPATKTVQAVPTRSEGYQQWPKQWGKSDEESFGFYGCVKVRGGEFLFAPSISFLKKLNPS